MARLVLTPKVPPGPYPATPLSANSADLAFTAAGADFADGAGFPMSSRHLVLVRNGNSGQQSVTFTSVTDQLNRKGDITTYALAAGEFGVFGPFERSGWMQTDGQLYFAASAADVEFAVIRV